MSGIAIVIPGADFSAKNLGKVNSLESRGDRNNHHGSISG